MEVLSASGAVVFVALALLTWRRNEVFATPARYWEDVIVSAFVASASQPRRRAHEGQRYARSATRDAQCPGARASLVPHTHQPWRGTSTRDDIVSSTRLGLQRYRNAKGLATAYAGLGEVEMALEQTKTLIEMDQSSALFDIRAISAPFLENPLLRDTGTRYYQKL